MKQILILVAMMLIMVGPSMALNPQYEIPLSTCEGEGFADGLLFDQYTYDAGYRVWEGFVEVDSMPFYLSETGMIQYLGAPLDVYTERGIQYFIYQIDEFGEPITGTYEGHNVGVNLNPCAVEPPVCECEPNDPGDNIRITPPTTIGQTVRSQWFPTGGNGDWQVRMYIDGVKTSKWNGEYPIEVIAKELDENWVPTGFEISDCICG